MQKIATISALVAAATAQQVGTDTEEVHPKMTWENCSAKGSCETIQAEVAIDSNWRWVHNVDGYDNCYDGNEWVDAICSGNTDCAEKCAVDGADYEGTYGVTTSGSALNLKFITEGEYSTNIGSRLYLMNGEDKYQMFTLLGNEFTFDVDTSELGCGLNGALYFVSMDEDGGLGRFPGNQAGAKYGTGYCDAQCPRDLKFIDGEANIDGWSSSDNDSNSGVGGAGSCCTEMDIWEANSISTAYTPHPCTTIGQHKCTGDSCGGTYSDTRYAGTCDPDGCDFNSYRQGDKSFYGEGMTVDTTKPMTVVTQFPKSASGSLEAIRRVYVQDGVVIANSESLIEGNPGNELNPEFCAAQKIAFGDQDVFAEKGGFEQFGAAVAEPMVLVMSLWDDHYSNMLWLDSTFPTDKDPEQPGIARGSCAVDTGVPSDVESGRAADQVTYSNIKFGPIDSTY